MSYAIDVNLLLYASDKSGPWHAKAISFLEQRTADPELFCIAWITLMSYLRISTHPSIFVQPLTPGEALQNVSALLQLPQVRTLAEAEGFLDIYAEFSGTFPVRGNLVPDAHLAALLKQHDIRVIFTADTDFRKFGFLDVRYPLI